jgi:hypothetical protein
MSQTDTSRIPCVALAVKSSPDPKDSTGAQIKEIVRHVEAGRDSFKPGERFFYVDPRTFMEESQSGWSKSRGSKTEGAMQAAIEAANQYGYAELWVTITSRPGRGSGKKDEARAYGEIWYFLRRHGVQVRSIYDPEFAEREELVGFGSKQSHDYSQALSANVKQAKRRDFEARKRLGAPVLDGYLHRVERDDRDRIVRTTYSFDPARAAVFNRMFALALAGHGAPTVARKLTAEGFRTEDGDAWQRTRIQDVLSNPFYAGLAAQRGENVNGKYRRFRRARISGPGDWPGYITPEQYEAIQAAEDTRDRAKPGREKASNAGRPTTRYVLHKLAVCAHCGHKMYCMTTPYKRKDGTQARHYVCGNHQPHKTGLCPVEWAAARVSAEELDPWIIESLGGLVTNLDEWFQGILSTSDRERDGLERALGTAQQELEQNHQRQTRAQAHYLRALDAQDDLKAEAVAGVLANLRAEEQRFQRALRSAEARLAEHGQANPLDGALDWYNALLRQRGGTVADVNEYLRLQFDAVIIGNFEDGTVVQPVLKSGDEGGDGWVWADESGQSITFSAMPAPPPLVIGGNAHEYRWRKWKRPALAASQP